jgi:hypothetical protein
LATYDELIHTMRIFSRIIDIVVLSVMWLFLPLAPLVCGLIAWEKQYALRYVSTLRQCAQMLREMMRAQVISRVLVRRASQRLPQRLSQHLGVFAVENKSAENKREERIEGECTHCGKCCINKSCVYLQVGENGESRCGIYNNWFWKQLTCGEYPISGEEIAIYDCPSFQAIPVKVIAFPALAKHAKPVAEGRYRTIPNRQQPRASRRG